MFCLAREWDGVGEVNPVAEVGAVVLGGRRVLMVVEGEVNQMVAGVVTFGVLLMFWVVSWMGDPSSGSTTASVLAYLSILDHFEDFSKGVIDTKHLAYYISFITFGLFLTVKSVDSERWRG